MTIRNMTLDDLQQVLLWAEQEGWNPGIDDAFAFFAADPKGFFIKEVGGRPTAAISVVNHNAAFAFLGLYLCRSDSRGQGYGIEIWRHAIRHAGARSIGLDGVPEQQANYAKSGFTKTGRTIRYQGQLPHEDAKHVRLAQGDDLERLIAADALVTGVSRTAFSRAWFSPAQTRQTHVLTASDASAFATTRACSDGIKVGPIHANSADEVMRLLMAAPRKSAQSALYVDVPEGCTAFADLLESQGFTAVIETARMYSGTPPKSLTPSYYAIASMELG